MNALLLRLTAIAALVLGFVLWMYGGARSGLYQTYYEIKKYDDILEFEYSEKVDAFLPGIETLVLGFGVFIVLLTASSIIESKLKAPAS